VVVAEKAGEHSRRGPAERAVSGPVLRRSSYASRAWTPSLVLCRIRIAVGIRFPNRRSRAPRVKLELGLISRRYGVGHRHTEQREQPRHFLELKRSVVGDCERYLDPRTWGLVCSRSKAPKLKCSELVCVRYCRIAEQLHLGERRRIIQFGGAGGAGADVDFRISDRKRKKLANLRPCPGAPDLPRRNHSRLAFVRTRAVICSC